MDRQKSQVYAAERAARARVADEHFGDKVSAWAFIEKVERDAWFRRKYGRRRFRVTHKHHGEATGGGSELALPRWAWTPMVILHEIAHCLTMTEQEWHGWKFCATHLGLVRHFMGKECYLRLRESYREHRVRYKKPVRRSVADMTPAQLAAIARFTEMARSRSKAAKAAKPEASA
jgi:hypothetical protein